MDVIVALLVPVLVLGMREHHPDHRHLRAARAGRKVPARAGTPAVSGDDFMESCDGRIMWRHNRDTHGQPAAVRESIM